MATTYTLDLRSNGNTLLRNSLNSTVKVLKPELVPDGNATRGHISFLRPNGSIYFSFPYDQLTGYIVVGVPVAKKANINEDITYMADTLFFKPSSGGGGGSVNSVTGNLVGGTPTNPVVSLSGTPMDIVTFDEDGNPEVKPIGITQLTDINGFPSFANGVFVATGMNAVDKTGLLLFIEFSTDTPKAGTFPTYVTGGVLKVANGVAPGDAVNKSQLDALPVMTQAMYDFVQSLMNSGNNI